MSATARLGLFVLLALIIVGFFILRIEQISIGGSDQKTVRAEFPSVAGLDEKSPVRIAGVRVGKVDHVELRDGRALLTLSIDPEIRLRQGARAHVRSLGLLGEQYIELVPGPAGAPALAEGAVLEGSSPQGFDQLLDTAGEVGSDLQSVTSSLRRTIGTPEGEARMQEILENVRQITAELRAAVAANRADVDQTIDNVRDFSESLKQELPRLADKLYQLADRVDTIVAENRDEIGDTLVNVRDLAAKLKTSAGDLNVITAKIAAGEGSIGKLVHDDTTVNNLNDTLTSVQSGIESFSDTFGRPAKWQLDVGLWAESLPRIDESRGTFQVDLHTRPERFYRVGLVDSPFGDVSETTERVSTDFEDGTTRTYVRSKQKVTDDYTFNAQVGYHVWPGTTVRAGLFESTGGVAVDQSLWRDRLKVTLEGYDWDRDENSPHVRLEGRFFVTPNIFAFTGWDDPAWSERSSVIIGGGITWRDEDLKYLLGTAASAAGGK
ncbi:MAG: MCE family protein [Acidobacteria bacterium]|nr:MCE family protein [Acidobacteriota bacterium]